MFQNSFRDREVSAELTAQMPLEVEAILFRADEPFTFTSGLKSPVYTDCRRLISFPRVRSALATWWDVLAVCRKFGYFDAQTLDGVEAFLKQPLEWSRAHGGVDAISI